MRHVPEATDIPRKGYWGFLFFTILKLTVLFEPVYTCKTTFYLWYQFIKNFVKITNLHIEKVTRELLTRAVKLFGTAKINKKNILKVQFQDPVLALSMPASSLY